MNNLLHHSKLFIKRNASTILTYAGGVGVVATSILAVKATPKAMKLLEQAKEEKGEDLTKLEVVKVAGPSYIPSIVMGASTLACVFGANIFSKRQQAALISAYTLLDNSYKEYKNKVEELYGGDANKNIRAEIAKDKYNESDLEWEDDKQLFYDDFSGRYFESTKEKVQYAEYILNKNLAVTSYVCLNEFYDLLEIDEIDGGDELGWYSGMLADMYWYSWIEFHHEKVVLDDGLECIVISMPYEPTADYMDY